MKSRFAGLVAAFFLLQGVIAPGASAAVVERSACAKAGITTTISGVAYRCSLVWIAQGKPSARATSGSGSETSSSATVFSGQGGLNEQTLSQPLFGTYQIAWQTFGPCTYYANLSDTYSSELFSADGALTGTNIIHDIPKGNYYLKVTTGPAPTCQWKVTLTPAK